MKVIYDKVRWLRILSLVVVDAVFANAAVLISLFIRFEFSVPNLVEAGFAQNYLSIAPVYTLVYLPG